MDYSSWHLYAYCANNPVNYVDPSGHKKIVLRIGAKSYEIKNVKLKVRKLKSYTELSQSGRVGGTKIQEISFDNNKCLLLKSTCKKLSSAIIRAWNDKKRKRTFDRKIRGNKSTEFGEMSVSCMAVEIFAHAALYYEYSYLKKMPKLKNKIKKSGKVIDVNRYDSRLSVYRIIWAQCGSKTEKKFKKKYNI